MTAINKAFATRAELVEWNMAINNMHRGIFAPAILEMIGDAEEENRQWDMMTRAIKTQMEDARHG